MNTQQVKIGINITTRRDGSFTFGEITQENINACIDAFCGFRHVEKVEVLEQGEQRAKYDSEGGMSCWRPTLYQFSFDDGTTEKWRTDDVNRNWGIIPV